MVYYYNPPVYFSLYHVLQRTFLAMIFHSHLYVKHALPTDDCFAISQKLDKIRECDKLGF